MVLQLAASGLRDNCCAGVRSCQAGLDEIFRVCVAFGGETGLGGLAEEDANLGVPAKPSAMANELDALKTVRKQKVTPPIRVSMLKG